MLEKARTLNTFISPQWVTTDCAVNYKNNLRLIGKFDRSWDDSWENKPKGAQIGYTVQARLYPRFFASEGQALVQQPILNQTVPITVNHQFHVGCGWSSADDAMLVEEVQRYTEASGIALANKWDVAAGAEVYKAVYYSIGSPGVPLSSDGTYTDGVAKLRNVGVPDDALIAVLDPKSQSALLKANFTLFNPQKLQSQNFDKGTFSGPALGVDEWAWDPNMPTHTTGTFTTSTPLVDGALQTGSTLVTKGWGTYSFNAGDVFVIAGVNGTNPHSFIDTGDIQQFTVQIPISGAGAATLTFSPPIILSGSALQTVTTSPANNASITFVGSTGNVNATMAAQTSKQSLLFNPAAFAFVMVDLPAKLPGAVSARKNDKDARVSMRWAEQWNIQTDQMPSRVDTMGGIAPILPGFALRAWS